MEDKLSSKRKTKKEKQLEEEKQINRRNTIILVLVFIVFAIAMVFVTIYITYDSIGNSKYFDKYNKNLSNELAEILSNQDTVDQTIASEVSSGKYTIDEPLIMNNPYGISPLTSLIIFNTPESTSVEVYVNDTLETTVTETTDHIIPIYGLYANAKNIVTLKCSDGSSNTYEITTESYDDDLEDYNLAQNIEDYKNIFVVGPNYTKQVLRAFDQNNNLVYYLDLDNITSFNFIDNKLYVGYNSGISYNNDMNNVRLQIDLIGRINQIDLDTSLLESTSNLLTDTSNYIMIKNNLYSDTTSNYTLTTLVDSVEESKYTTVSTSDIDKNLVNATIYTDNYSLALNGNYITFDFGIENDNAALILVNRSDNYAYKYSIDDVHYIKVNNIKQASLYLFNNGRYYNLLSTYNN